MPREEALSPAAPALVEALRKPAAYDDGVTEVRFAETHISWVFLTGRYAYKIKKPIKLPFLDFSTLELRRHFCDEELRLNRRLAPNLYIGVVPIGGNPNAPRIGVEPAIEYAVKMRQFPEDARLDKRLESGALEAQPLRVFAERLALFHSGLPPLTPQGASELALGGALDNFFQLEKHAPRADLGPVLEWTKRCAAALGPRIDRRASDGRYRECHGDLHLENLLVQDGEIVAFDALEFDAKLREIDVASETAFLTMDLLAHGRGDLAYSFLTRYLEESGDYDGLKVLRFYLVHRALVRAKVRAIKAEQGAAEPGRDALAPYLAVANDLVAPRTPLLLITHGLSGSGKTHVTQELIGALCAVRVRSDLERKRLHGLAADARTDSPVGGGLYDASATQRTYERLAEIADAALRSGFDTIVDATFLLRAERAQFRALAHGAGARYAILESAAPEGVLRGRIVERERNSKDASEAGLAVLDRQLAEREPLGADEARDTVRVATDWPPDTAAVLARLRAL